MRRLTVGGLLTIAASLLLLGSILQAGAVAPANEYFQRTWARTDQPVVSGQAVRTWMWGPEGFTGQLTEPYAESPGGQRSVQYFDKARMEITSPGGDSGSIWYVTNGLLVGELISGRLQLGDASFSQRQPAAVNVAGDADDAGGPVYASFTALLDAAPAAAGSLLTKRVNRAGQITDDPSLGAQGQSIALIDDVTNHAIAAPFWNFMTSSGAVWDGNAYITAPLFENAYFATGRPISEAYWANVKVGGTYQDVLMQCFERRCLTYNPANAPEWQVEAGNVGRHYHAWRYDEPSGPTPSPTEPEEPTTRYGFDFAFGEPYVPTDRLKQPRGIGLDGLGNLWVADTLNNRMVAFDADGRYVTRFGTAGSAEGQFSSPHDIAFDSTGSAYVVDTWNYRVQKFSPAGQFVKTWGGPGAGNADGQFYGPFCIEVHDDVVYVCDTLNDRIQRFSTEGDYLGKWGTPGAGPGQFNDPHNLAFDADGNVYVTDTWNRRIQKFDTSFEYITEFRFDEDPGMIGYPSGVAVDENFNVYVTVADDTASDEIVVFEPDGDFLRTIGQRGTGLGLFNSVVSIALDPDGNLYTVDDGFYFLADEHPPQVQKFAPDGTPSWRITDGSRFRFNVPLDIAVKTTGEVAVSDGTDPGFGRVAIWSLDGEPGVDINYLNDLSVPSTYTPTGVAVAPNGDIYVVDAFQHNIWRFNADREPIDHWGTFGSGPGQFDGPRGVAVDAGGNVYVVDNGNSRVQKFDATGVLLDGWGSAGSGDSQFSYPNDVAVYGERVYVTDAANHRVQVFNLAGEYQGQWGSAGAGPGEFNYPAGIAVDSAGYVYVVDGDNNRIQKFTSQGEHLATFGLGGANTFDAPDGIAVAPDGRVYVVDTDNQRVVVFRPDD